jgi:hypothetical protein
VCWGNLMGKVELLAKVCGPPKSSGFYLWGKLKKCYVYQQSSWTGGSKTEYSWSNLQHSATWIATSFPKSVNENSGMFHSRG